MMHASDRRIKLQNEAIGSAKMIKLNAWEEPLMRMVDHFRSEEVRTNRRMQLLSQLNYAVFTMGPVFVAVAAFTLFVVAMGGELTPFRVFPALTVFTMLRFPVMFYPRVLSQLADASVSLHRIQRYLLLDETASVAPRDGGGRVEVAEGGL